ncbi:hypothetical protein SS209_00269 [Salmonella enterica subsp. enterica serovar Senftenberg str. SS209]|nr:hypothetical protein SS209_00269 [Salmonella enterica subsp. enterica serovar Senftenberg str. SS209]
MAERHIRQARGVMISPPDQNWYG